MQIPQELRQFHTNKTLLITASQHESKLHMAYKGEINLIKELKVEKPEFSDNEEGALPSPEKNIKLIEKQNFAKAFNELLSEVEDENFNEVYLFTPQELNNEMESLLPQKLSAKLKRIIKGNYNKKHPTELIEELNKLK